MAFTVTDIIEMEHFTLLLFWKIIFSEWKGWAIFVNCISLLGHMKNLKRFISTPTRPTTINLGGVATEFEGLPFTWSQIPLIMWSREKLKTFYLHFHKTYKHQTWHSGNLSWGAPTGKVICAFDHVVARCQVTKDHKIYKHQTSDSSKLGWLRWIRATYQVICSFDHVASGWHITK